MCVLGLATVNAIDLAEGSRRGLCNQDTLPIRSFKTLSMCHSTRTRNDVPTAAGLSFLMIKFYNLRVQ